MEDYLQNKLENNHRRHLELQELLQDSSVYTDTKKYRELSQEYAHSQTIEHLYQEYLSTELELSQTQELLSSDEEEIFKIAYQEEEELLAIKNRIIKKIELALIPLDPLEAKNIIVEIRAGTGGEEAALFAGELYRAYFRFSESKRFKTELISFTPSALEGFKEVVFSIEGQGPYSWFRYESGTHRVQRVPVTESNGKLQTSAVTVAVLPEIEETEINIKDSELRIDVFRAQGAGGQHVNTTDSAVRITYLPLNIVVSCQDEKSQLKNKQRAMKVLRTRIFDFQQQQQQKKRSEERKGQVGSGDRSERIRTYNFPQNRVTDHRAGLTFYTLEKVMQGDLEDLISQIKLNLDRPQTH